MNRIVFVSALLIATTSLAAKQTTDTDREHTQWIASVMDSIQTIKPGMTREDLSKVFTTEGGLSLFDFNARTFTKIALISKSMSSLRQPQTPTRD